MTKDGRIRIKLEIDHFNQWFVPVYVTIGGKLGQATDSACLRCGSCMPRHARNQRLVGDESVTAIWGSFV